MVVLGLALLAFYKKSWFVAATVNGEPITSVELMSKLNQDYRQQALDQMVNERIITQEARKKGITVTQKDIDDKIAEVETQVGGADALNGLLSQQGQTKEGLKGQLKIQILVEKLYGSEATVSAEEIETYITQNSATLQSTDSAKQRVEAESALKQQKLTDIFGQKFQSLKDGAKILIFQ